MPSYKTSKAARQNSSARCGDTLETRLRVIRPCAHPAHTSLYTHILSRLPLSRRRRADSSLTSLAAAGETMSRNQTVVVMIQQLQSKGDIATSCQCSSPHMYPKLVITRPRRSPSLSCHWRQGPVNTKLLPLKTTQQVKSLSFCADPLKGSRPLVSPRAELHVSARPQRAYAEAAHWSRSRLQAASRL